MPARMYYDNDADLAALAGQTVAVIGYGSQGHAHALDLRDSGVSVIVGLAPGSRSRPVAEAAGLRVMDVAEAVKAADVIMLALPDTVQKAVYDAEIAPYLRAGQLLMFAHGFNIRFGRIVPPASVDVGMVAPKGPGHLVRSVYESGGGVPALFAVEQDPRARREPGSWPMRAAWVPRVPASSRRPSPRRPRPTSSGSRRSSAAASRPS